MAWVNIAEQTAVTATLDSSSPDVILTPDGYVFPDGAPAQLVGWTLSLSQPVRIGVRILADPYVAEGGGAVTGGLSTDADNPNLPYERTGSSIAMPYANSGEIIGGELPATYLQYDPAVSGETLPIPYNIFVYVWDEAPPGPTSGSANVIPIQLRGYVVADAPQVLWARGDTGPLSLAGDVVEAHIRPPGKHVDLMVIPAVGGAAGQIAFTVPAAFGDKYGAGQYQITIVSAAYGVTHDGTLEIV